MNKIYYLDKGIAKISLHCNNFLVVVGLFSVSVYYQFNNNQHILFVTFISQSNIYLKYLILDVLHPNNRGFLQFDFLQKFLYLFLSQLRGKSAKFNYARMVLRNICFSCLILSLKKMLNKLYIVWIWQVPFSKQVTVKIFHYLYWKILLFENLHRKF